MKLSLEESARAAAVPQPGTGVPCRVAQCDGVPCADVVVDCEHCDRSTGALCDEHRHAPLGARPTEHRDATGDSSSDATPQPTLRHA
jgi:hypothetical protein